MKSQPPKPRTPASRPSPSAGFSLIEVAVTIAIAAFIVSTVVTVVPMALSWHRDSIQSSVTTAAVQELVREIEQTPFYSSGSTRSRDLSYYEGRKFYFDFEGTRLPDSAPADDVVFQAQVHVLDGGVHDLDSDAVLERDPAAPTSSTIRRVVVGVLFRPGDKSASLFNKREDDDGRVTLEPLEDNVQMHSLLISDRGAEPDSV
jgi:uncharacterized protein (TIGR02598 family)